METLGGGGGGGGEVLGNRLAFNFDLKDVREEADLIS